MRTRTLAFASSFLLVVGSDSPSGTRSPRRSPRTRGRTWRRSRRNGWGTAGRHPRRASGRRLSGHTARTHRRAAAAGCETACSCPSRSRRAAATEGPAPPSPQPDARRPSPVHPTSWRCRSPTMPRSAARSCSPDTASSFPRARTSGTTAMQGSMSTDKIVVVLRYFPEDADQNTRAILARYADLRYKAMAARQRGARALLVVTGPRSPNAGETVPMSSDTALSGSGLPAASISSAAAAALFTGNRSLEDVQRELDTGNPHAMGSHSTASRSRSRPASSARHGRR
jgi:hypothetical protein